MNVSPTRLGTGWPGASRSMPEPSSAGWFAGSASTWKIFAAGAATDRETETCTRLLRSIP